MLLDKSELKLPFSRIKVQYECRIPKTGVKLPKNEKVMSIHYEYDTLVLATFR